MRYIRYRAILHLKVLTAASLWLCSIGSFSKLVLIATAGGARPQSHLLSNERPTCLIRALHV